MADISKIQLKSTIYDVKDASARERLTGHDSMVVISDTQPTSSSNRLWVPETLSGGVTVPTYAELVAVENEVTALRAAVGSPLVAGTAADMTNHDKIYVYTGSESGYSNGHLYYWDGSAWSDGGIYNETALETDPTLTIEGRAADAKACGDLKNTLNSVVTTVNSFVPSAKITRTSQETGTINCPSASRHFLLITSSFATVYWFGYLIVASNGTPTAVEFIKGAGTTVATSKNIFSITSGRGSTSWVIADIILLGNACS